ncbi:MAG: hypothetical protein ACLP1D_11190, partial [Xanthobacteraceae bacterium]
MKKNTVCSAFFISGPLQRFAGADPDRCERFLSTVLNRVPEKNGSDEKRRRDNIEEAAGNLVALLYVKFANQNAWSWVIRWVDDLTRSADSIVHKYGSPRV